MLDDKHVSDEVRKDLFWPSNTAASSGSQPIDHAAGSAPLNQDTCEQPSTSLTPTDRHSVTLELRYTDCISPCDMLRSGNGHFDFIDKTIL